MENTKGKRMEKRIIRISIFKNKKLSFFILSRRWVMKKLLRAAPNIKMAIRRPIWW